MDVSLLVFYSIVSLGSFGIGLWALIFSLFRIVWGIKSKTWSDVAGIVTESNLKKKEYTDEDGKEQHYYEGRISYSYELNGIQYVSNRISFDNKYVWQSTKDSPIFMHTKYPRSKSVRVFYNPKKPRLSTLEQGLKLSNVFGFLIGLLFMGLGITIFFLGLPEIVK